MTSITGSLYSTLNAYTGLSSLSNSDQEAEAVIESTAAAASSGDTVSLSGEVAVARAREYLGLAPTGNLTLSDFETAAGDQEEAVAEMLVSAMADLGIPETLDISLSLDSDGGISIAQEFPGKDVLETSLNQDENFLKAFTGLSTNTEVLDYAQSLTTFSPSLADYIGGDTSDTDLLSLAKRYSALKSADSIQDLWQLSHNQTPFTYEYSGKE